MFLVKTKQKLITLFVSFLIFSGATVTDCDGDGVANDLDNCEGDFTGLGKNVDQKDFDGDGIGDACDLDQDQDGIVEVDVCPFSVGEKYSGWVSNAKEDNDGDGCRDIDEDLDRDNDDIVNDKDNCPNINNRDQRDTDNDGIGEVCDTDKDNDGITNDIDNCLQTKNPDQLNYDEDKFGDLCDNDDDNDSLADSVDSCPQGVTGWTSAIETTDLDQDGCQDSSEDLDDDADLIPDLSDNCPLVTNSTQEDDDGNGVGNTCDKKNPAVSDELLSADKCQYSLPETCGELEPINIASCYLTKANPDNQESCALCSNDQSDCRKNVVKNIFEGCGLAKNSVDVTNLPGCDVSAKKINHLLAEKSDLRLKVLKEFTRSTLPNTLSSCSSTDIAYCSASGNNALCACAMSTGLNLYIESYSSSLSNICFSSSGIDSCDCAYQLPSKVDGTFSLSCKNKNYLIQTGASVLVAEEDRLFSKCYELKLGALKLEDPDATLSFVEFSIDSNNNKIPDTCEIIKNPSDISKKTGCTNKAACNYNANAILSASCIFAKSWYKDIDGDNLGDLLDTIKACEKPTGYVTNSSDNCPVIENADITDTDGDKAGDLCDTDDDNDGALDIDDAFPLDPTKQGSNCEEDFDEDEICDDVDTDDDSDGSLDVNDSSDNDSNVCSDTDNDNCDDCSNGSFNISNDGIDFDSDGLCDTGDTDDDGDNRADNLDSNDNNASVCADTDSDTCDDCSSGSFNVSDDGADFDSDGLCDAGDTDDDGDNRADNLDSNDNNASVCADTDTDTCDDCSSGSFDVSNDGADFDSDGLCDAGDTDDDGDNRADNLDSNNNNSSVCADTDGDTCDDCSSGSFDVSNDGTDSDSDGICNPGDPDDDGDGIADGSDLCPQGETGWTSSGGTDFDGDGCRDSSEDTDDDNDGSSDLADSSDNNSSVCSDTDSDTCEDCVNGSYDPSNDGVDTDSDGTCDAGELDCAGNPGGTAVEGDCGACLETLAGTILSGKTPVVIDSSLTQPAATVGVDLDNDNDYDIVVVDGGGTGKIYYYLNDGTGSFGTATEMTTSTVSFNETSEAYAADLDKNGHLDIIASSQTDDKLIWLKNNGGLSFTQTDLISGSVDGPTGFTIIDINDDGELDLVTISSNDDELKYHINNGSESFTTTTVYNGAAAVNPKSVAAEDLDGDEDIDLLVGYGAGLGVRLYTNNGSLSFGDSQILAIANVKKIGVFDADADGDMDLAMASSTEGDGTQTVYFLRNSNLVFTSNVVSNATVDPRAIAIADINNDGYLDIIASGHKNIRWFAHNGNNSSPSFGSAVNVYQEDGDVTLGMWNISARDFDGDSDLDLLTSRTPDGKVIWVENDSIDCQDSCEDMNFYYTDSDSDGDGHLSYFIFDCIADADPAPTGYSKNKNDTDPTCSGARDCTGECGGDAENTDDSCGICWEYDTSNLTSITGTSVTTNHTATASLAIDLDNDQDYDIVSYDAGGSRFVYQLNNGSGTFGGVTQLITSIEDVGDMQAADMDSDLDIDIVYTDPDNNQVYWLENGGSYSFTEATVLTYNNMHSCYCDPGGNPWVDTPVAISLGDLDSDGDIDIAMAPIGSNSDSLKYVLNDGTGSFGDVKDLGGGGDTNPRDLVMVDVDDDGDTDVVVAYESSEGLKVFRQQAPMMGNLNFGAEAIDNGVSGFGVAAGDLDNDGDIDVVVADNSGEISWYENDGQTNPQWTQNSLATDAVGPLNVEISDFDNDLDLDILMTSEEDIKWFENNGNANPSFTKITVFTGSSDDVYTSTPRDLDLDGDLDILASFTTDTDLIWFENNYAECLDGCSSIETFYGDSDSDSDGYYADFYYTCEEGAGAPSGYSLNSTDTDPTCGVVRDCLGECGGTDTSCNDCAGTPNGTAEYSVSTTETQITGSTNNPKALYSVDLDEDGDIDIVSASYEDDQIAWIENDNGLDSFTFHSITTSLDGARGLLPIDLDEDGDLDIVASGTTAGDLVWYANDGSQSFSLTTIDASVNTIGHVEVADMDGDDDLDIVTVSRDLDDVYLYKNNGSESFTKSTIHDGQDGEDGTIYQPSSFKIADMDGDSDLDIVLASELNSKLYWLENDGDSDPSFDIEDITGGASLSGPQSVALYDMDGDGDSDIVVASTSNDKVYTYITNAGGPNFQAHNVQENLGPPPDPSPFDEPTDVYVTDLDGDGNPDILISARTTGSIFRFEYDGETMGQHNYTKFTVKSGTTTPVVTSAADLNGDDIIDVIGASATGDAINWYEADCAEP